jgi:hypothetical protein
MALVAARVGIPVAIAVAGVALIIAGQARVRTGQGLLDSSLAAIGVALIVCAIIVWMINWMFRMSIQSNRDREEEEQARRYFDEHGRWHDEEPR